MGIKKILGKQKSQQEQNKTGFLQYPFLKLFYLKNICIIYSNDIKLSMFYIIIKIINGSSLLQRITRQE